MNSVNIKYYGKNDDIKRIKEDMDEMKRDLKITTFWTKFQGIVMLVSIIIVFFIIALVSGVAGATTPK